MKRIVSILACMLFFLTGNAQSDSDVEARVETNGFSNSNAALNYFSSQSHKVISGNSSTSGNNSVYIEQTQNNNNVYSNISAESSEINIFQNGNYNYAHLDITAKSVSQDVIQMGDRNNYFNYTNLPGQERNTEVIQQGNDTRVEIYGNNSLSQEMKVNVQGNGKSVIVRNF